MSSSITEGNWGSRRMETLEFRLWVAHSLKREGDLARAQSCVLSRENLVDYLLSCKTSISVKCQMFHFYLNSWWSQTQKEFYNNTVKTLHKALEANVCCSDQVSMHINGPRLKEEISRNFLRERENCSSFSHETRTPRLSCAPCCPHLDYTGSTENVSRETSKRLSVQFHSMLTC